MSNTKNGFVVMPGPCPYEDSPEVRASLDAALRRESIVVPDQYRVLFKGKCKPGNPWETP